MPHAVPFSVWLGVQHAHTLCIYVCNVLLYGTYVCEMARLDLYTVHEIHIWVWDTLATLHAGSVACMHDFGLVCCVCVCACIVYTVQVAIYHGNVK